MNTNFCIIIDSDKNIYKVKQKAIQEGFDKKIAPLDIISQVGNDNELELVHELDLDYVKQLESGLVKALDKISKLDDSFDYYNTLRELTGFQNCQALDFIDMFNEDKESVIND